MENTKEAKNVIRRWMKSDNNDVCYVKHNGVEYAYFRHKFREGLDVIYAYNEVENGQIKFNAEPIFQGIYKISTKVLYMASGITEKIIGRNMFSANTYDMLRCNFIEAVRIGVEEEVDKWQTEIDADSRIKQTPYAESVARRQYLMNRSDKIQYECGYKAEDFENIVLECIADEKAMVQKTVTEFCEEQKADIMQELIRDKLTIELIKDYRNGKNSYLTTLYNIIHSIPKDCKTVNVTILRNDIELTFKYDAEQLRKDCRGGYNTWYLTNNDRQRYYAAYGDCRDFTPNDIIKITYSRKVLYERKA